MKAVIIRSAIALALMHGSLALAADDNADLIKRGEYLATASDCTACHTAPGGPAYGGGYPVATPFGKIWGSNISSDKQFGIGSWTDDQFVAAVRQGVGKNGEQLYPAMPYDAFTKMKRDDVLAIKAYLMSLPGVHKAAPETDLPFPFNQRWGMRFWKMFNLTEGELKNDPQQSPQWNNGRYLVEALAHCTTCHTPRNLTMGMDTSKPLSGGDLGDWIAFNITPGKSGIGDWSNQDIVTYLKTGYLAGKASASGPMAEAIEHSLQYLPDSDLQDIATYLKSVKPVDDEKQTVPRDSQGQPSDAIIRLRGADAATVQSQPGAVVFEGNCSTCHGAEGAGSGQGFHAYPSLFHHSSTGAIDPKNVVSVILNGVNRHMQQGDIFMPSFAPQLNDQQVADVANFVMQKFGNPAAEKVDASQVSKARKNASLPLPPTFADGANP